LTLDARPGRRALFAVLFLLSGAVGLMYEQLWIRELQHFFGSTLHSITTVVAAYMGGLGLGAYFVGRRADRHKNPALLYGLLELAIGVFGLLSPLVFALVGSAYLGVARLVEPGLWLATAIKFVFSFAVMLIPTFLMGATLPVLTRAFAGERTLHLRRELGLFYGLNTVGGVIGCALGGYYLVEYVGVLPSLLGCGVINLALGGIAIAATRGETTATLANEPEPEMLLHEPAAAVRRLAIQLIALTAFASLLYEIAWTRVLVLVVGSSTYAFTTILVCFLLGIGLGSLVAAGQGRSIRERLMRVALLQSAIAVLAALLFPFFRVLPVYVVATMKVPFLSPTALIVLQSIALAVVIIPPAFGMGLAFPMLTELAASQSGTTGRETGRAYFANTMGSILGSIVTGFLLVHLVGVRTTLIIGVAINVLAVALVSWRLFHDGGRQLASGERSPLLLGALALIVAVFTPAWSSRLLDRGPAIYGRDVDSAAELDHFLRGFGAEQLRFDEGWNATVSVWRNGGTTWLKTNGKSDASSIADMNAQVMMGLLPTLAHPRPSRVFLVGFGSGTTARAIADAPGVAHLDIVEIERAVIRAAPLFAEVNRDVLSDPRVRLIEDDARSALQLAREPYDVIVSEPSNPWVAGIAALYTREYLKIIRSRLKPDGVFAQWVQTYRVPVGVVAVVVANVRAAFPHVEMWFANPSDLILLGSNQPVQWNEARLRALLEPGTATQRSMHDWLEVDRPSAFLGRFLLGDKGTAALAATARFVHSDNQPALEFIAARGLLATGLASVFDSVTGVRTATGDTLPHLVGWTLAPGEWEAAYARALPAGSRIQQRYADRALTSAPHDPQRRGEAGVERFAKNEFRVAIPYLQDAVRARPGDARYLLPLGLSLSLTGDLAGGRAMLERSRVAGGDSVYAASVLAETATGEKDWPRAAAEVSRALRGLRPTIATPFPQALQNAVSHLATDAPPEIAAPVMDEAVRLRPHWDLAFHGAALVNVRWGGEHCARAAQLADELTRFGWTESEVVALLRPCRVGR
jgi:spermidine synthase